MCPDTSTQRTDGQTLLSVTDSDSDLDVWHTRNKEIDFLEATKTIEYKWEMMMVMRKMIHAVKVWMPINVLGKRSPEDDHTLFSREQRVS